LLRIALVFFLLVLCFFNFIIQYLFNWRLSLIFFHAFYDLGFIIFLFHWVTSGLFIYYSLLSLFFKTIFILELNRIDLLNIDGCSLNFVLFNFFSRMLLSLCCHPEFCSQAWTISTIFIFILWWVMVTMEWQWCCILVNVTVGVAMSRSHKLITLT